MGRLATDTGDPNPLTKSRPMLGLAIARTVLQRLPTWPFPVLFWASDHHAHGRYLRIGWWNGGLVLGEFRPTESLRLKITEFSSRQTKPNQNPTSSIVVKCKSNPNQTAIREELGSLLSRQKCLRRNVWDFEISKGWPIMFSGASELIRTQASHQHHQDRKAEKTCLQLPAVPKNKQELTDQTINEKQRTAKSWKANCERRITNCALAELTNWLTNWLITVLAN